MLRGRTHAPQVSAVPRTFFNCWWRQETPEKPHPHSFGGYLAPYSTTLLRGRHTSLLIARHLVGSVLVPAGEALTRMKRALALVRRTNEVSAAEDGTERRQSAIKRTAPATQEVATRITRRRHTTKRRREWHRAEQCPAPRRVAAVCYGEDKHIRARRLEQRGVPYTLPRAVAPEAVVVEPVLIYLARRKTAHFSHLPLIKPTTELRVLLQYGPRWQQATH